jgi:hypothetical protein
MRLAPAKPGYAKLRPTATAKPLSYPAPSIRTIARSHHPNVTPQNTSIFLIFCTVPRRFIPLNADVFGIKLTPGTHIPAPRAHRRPSVLP